MIAVPGRVRHRRLVLKAGEVLRPVAADWADTLVVVLGGELELTCRSGRRASFPAGSVLTLDGIAVRELHNPAARPLILHLVRRADDDLTVRASHRRTESPRTGLS